MKSKVGESRVKTGGRAKGTPNRRTLDIQQRLDALRCDPIEGMARIAMDAANPPELRGRMFAELAQYVAPKRKSVEVHAEVESTHVQKLVADSNELLTQIRSVGD